MENRNKRVCVLSFSGRRDGNCAAISQYIRQLHGGRATVYGFSDFDITPCGGCRHECFTKQSACPFAHDMERTLVDGVLSHGTAYFIVPNYCDYPCSNFFVFTQRQQGCFQHDPSKQRAYEQAEKRFIVVSNTEQDNFTKAFSYHCVGQPHILFLRARQYGKISLAGDLLSAGQAKEAVKDFVLAARPGPG